MKKTIATLFLVTALFLPMFSQAPASSAGGQSQVPDTQALPPDAASKEQLKKLFEVIGVQKQMQGVVTSMAGSLEQMMPAAGQLSEKQKAEMSKLESELFGKMMSPEFTDSYLDMMVPAYQRHFSKSDVDQVIAFYSSPAGQKFVNEQPAIMQEVFPKLLPMMQQHMQDVMKETNYEQRMKAIFNEDEKSEEKPK
jgi:uncharacterized protein